MSPADRSLESNLQAQLHALAARVDRLESQRAITALATHYARTCDEHDMPGLIGLFTHDASFDSPSKVMIANGRDAIAAMFIGLFKIRGPAFHWTHVSRWNSTTRMPTALPVGCTAMPRPRRTTSSAWRQ